MSGKFKRLVMRPISKEHGSIPKDRGAGPYLLLRVDGVKILERKLFEAHAEGTRICVPGFTHYVKLDYLF